ncbi:MAG: hypothetical protein BWY64_02569 [bacterium ADurb.Bin363]|nr:MAG: hypothetical protein BWY64_02569 [bacterium ADurb.Bin363]
MFIPGPYYFVKDKDGKWKKISTADIKSKDKREKGQKQKNS